MRDYYENIWTFETRNFRIDYDAAPDEDLDLSWDDTGEIRAGLESGKYVHFQARVTVTHKASETVLGADYLGGCIYENPSEFIRGSGYFRDMISEAIAAARANWAGEVEKACATCRDMRATPMRAPKALDAVA